MVEEGKRKHGEKRKSVQLELEDESLGNEMEGRIAFLRILAAAC
jgi:hypothetical protein